MTVQLTIIGLGKIGASVAASGLTGAPAEGPAEPHPDRASAINDNRMIIFFMTFSPYHGCFIQLAKIFGRLRALLETTFAKVHSFSL